MHLFLSLSLYIYIYFSLGGNMLSSIITLVCVFTVLTYACKIVYWLWLGPKLIEKSLRNQGLRGNSYRFLCGDAKEIMSMIEENKSKSIEISNDDITTHVLPYHHHYSKLHGKSHFMWLGTTPRLSLVDPKLIKDLLNQYTSFQKPQLNSLAKLLLKGLISKEGEDWVKHRVILNPCFQLEKLKLLVPAMYSSCSEMITKWEDLFSRKESCEVDVHPYFINLSADVISRTTFGRNYKEGEKICLLQREQAALVLELLHSIYIPGWRFLPTRTNKKIKEINREVEALLRDIIDRREKALKAGRGETTDDLLEILVKTNLKEIEEQGNKKNTSLTIEDIIDECKLFYTAAQETSAILLSWTFVMLSKHQIWQNRARDEIKDVFGDNKPGFNELNRLKVLTMILNEVLRLYPPLSNLVRATRKKTKLGKYVIPAGVEISIPIMAIHTDPDIWGKDATKFNPDRFSEGVAKATDKQLVFLPMGAGPRICIGQNFALLEAKLVIAMILQRFSVRLSSSYVHAPSPTIELIRPQHGVPLILKKYKVVNQG